jgi:hypothetical protein
MIKPQLVPIQNLSPERAAVPAAYPAAAFFYYYVKLFEEVVLPSAEVNMLLHCSQTCGHGAVTLRERESCAV